MRNPFVSKVSHLEKNELKYIKMHKALVFLQYCLERYDCFSIYKIESGQFKFVKNLHAIHCNCLCSEGTLASFFCTQLSIQYCMGKKSSSVEVLGKNQELMDFKLIVRRKKSIKERSTCWQRPHTALTHPFLVQKGSSIQENYLGKLQCCI